MVGRESRNALPRSARAPCRTLARILCSNWRLDDLVLDADDARVYRAEHHDERVGKSMPASIGK